MQELRFDENYKLSLSDEEIGDKSFHSPMTMLRELAEAPATDITFQKPMAEQPDHAVAAESLVAHVYHRLKTDRNGEIGLPENSGL